MNNKKTFKLIGIPYYAINCKNKSYALVTFLKNKCGVTSENIEETNEQPMGEKVFECVSDKEYTEYLESLNKF